MIGCLRLIADGTTGARRTTVWYDAALGTAAIGAEPPRQAPISHASEFELASHLGDLAMSTPMASSRIPGPLGGPFGLIVPPDPTDPLAWTDGASARLRPEQLLNQLRHHLPGPMDHQLLPRRRHHTDRILTLLRFGGAPERGIAEEDYQAAAVTLDVEIDAIKAVSRVETKTAPFDKIGRVAALFERHYFHRLTKGKYDATHPRISNPLVTPVAEYGPRSVQYLKIEEGYLLNADAALSSASWGAFQIMGENFSAAGYVCVRDFVLALAESETAHLQAFVQYVQHHAAMLGALRAKKWAEFARRYNGPLYAKNNYDTRMAAAYQLLAKERADAKSKGP